MRARAGLKPAPYIGHPISAAQDRGDSTWPRLSDSTPEPRPAWSSFAASGTSGPPCEGRGSTPVFSRTRWLIPSGGCRNTPEVVYAGVTQDGLYCTRDEGRHWQRMLEGDIRWVTVDPAEDRVVYAGTEPVKLFRSEDGGDSWEELEGLRALPPEVQQHWWFPYPPHHGHVRHIYIDPDNTDTLYLAPGARRHRAQLRPGQDLGGRERGHRVSGRAHDRPLAPRTPAPFSPPPPGASFAATLPRPDGNGPNGGWRATTSTMSSSCPGTRRHCSWRADTVRPSTGTDPPAPTAASIVARTPGGTGGRWAPDCR